MRRIVYFGILLFFVVLNVVIWVRSSGLRVENKRLRIENNNLRVEVDSLKKMVKDLDERIVVLRRKERLLIRQIIVCTDALSSVYSTVGRFIRSDTVRFMGAIFGLIKRHYERHYSVPKLGLIEAFNSFKDLERQEERWKGKP